MRFNAIAALCKEGTAQDSIGNTVPTVGEPREVFANVYEIGLNSYLAARASGLHADAELQLRSGDYDGEEIVLFGGNEYTVERVSDSGEFTRLTLARRLANVDC